MEVFRATVIGGNTVSIRYWGYL